MQSYHPNGDSFRFRTRIIRAFYEDVVAPIVGEVEHCAALLGEGSQILGFDTERSQDHGWGLQVQLFVHADEVAGLEASIEQKLPIEFKGLPVRFYKWQSGRADHHVTVTTLSDWLKTHLGYDLGHG